MTLNDLERLNSPYFVFFTDFDCFAGQLRHSGQGQTYNILKCCVPVQFKKCLSSAITIRFPRIFNTQGRIYPQRGPCSKKMWGPSPRKKLAITGRVSAVNSHFPEKLATFLLLIMVLSLPIISGMQNIRRSFCGAPFLWGPLFGRTC